MSLHVAVLGTDGTGKSTITAALPIVFAAEFGLTCAGAGETFRVSSADEDHLAPEFEPDGVPLTARLARWCKRGAKRVVDNRMLYPPVKLAHMIFQDDAAVRLGRRHQAPVVVSDGNALLSATGRAANYLNPASEGNGVASGPAEVDDLRAVFSYVLDGEAIPAASQSRLPNLARARAIYRCARLLGVRAGHLPDVVVFLDLSPEASLERIADRGGKQDRHENAADLGQARDMYLRALDALREYRPEVDVLRIKVEGCSPGEVLIAVVAALRARIDAQLAAQAGGQRPLGTTEGVDTRSVWAKVVNRRYLFGYLFRKWFVGAWREPFFMLSEPGRQFLREGYSAGVMRVIYDRPESGDRFWSGVFQEYPLHRAVYDRLQILTRSVGAELERLLECGGEVRIFTAPSGFAYDLFRPIESLVAKTPELLGRLRLVACDLDPHGAVADELRRRAEQIGLAFEFVTGDLTDEAIQEDLAARGPFDLALFVGLSSWLPKPGLVGHARWLAANLRHHGALVTDAFTAGAYALSGRYVGYKAHYYRPSVYAALMDYAGFTGLGAFVESGRDGLNHVMVFRPREAQ